MLNRRLFASGLCAAFVSGRVRAQDRARKKRAVPFRPYRPGKTLAPITCVTPDDGFYIHTFFDVCPFSPSGRYLACLRLPFEDRLPDWKDTADVCVIDLKERTIETVYTTSAFGMQTGAQLQWGRTDRFLYFNDKSEKAGGHAVAVRLDWQPGKAQELAGPIYHLKPDESGLISFNLDLINHVQDGYGCVVAPQHRLKLPAGAARDQGLWHTDLKTNRKKLLVSLEQIYEALPNKEIYKGLAFHLFHSKYNPQGTRIMQVVRARDPESPEGRYKHGILTTFDADGSNIRVAMSPEFWKRGGHHPNWHPDGERLLMNATPKDTMRFCLFRYDGSEFSAVSERFRGSGHPAFEKTGRYIFTDAYPGEPVALPNHEVPLRLIDTKSDQEKIVATVFTLGPKNPSVLRLDPHPAWSRDGKSACFNGAPEGHRQVFVVDLKGLLA
jgi:hypothetical protein